MSLHDDIMNIPHAFDTYPFGRMERVSYVTGHRDARHAAAELAVEADTEIERLKAENAGLRAQIEAARPPHQRNDAAQTHEAAGSRICGGRPQLGGSDTRLLQRRA